MVQVDYDESLNTLRYASRAKYIKNKPKINRDPMFEKMTKLQERCVYLEKLCLTNGIDTATGKMTMQPTVSCVSTVFTICKFPLFQDYFNMFMCGCRLT